MRRWLVRVLVVLALAGAALILRATVFAPEPISVRAVAVQRGTVAATVTNSKAGTVRARRRAKLAPEASGVVAEIPHAEGERVEVGALLLRLESSSQRASLTLAERSLDVARALHEKACVEARRAERELARNRELAHESIVSEDVLDRFESARDLAVASCAAAEAEARKTEAAVEAARAELEKTAIRAPFAGVIAELAPEIGEWVTPSPPLLQVPPVVDLIDPSSLYVSAPMDEVDSSRIEVGQTAVVTVDAFPERAFAGRVARVAAFVLDVEAQNRTVEIEVELEDGDTAQRLLPGTSADVEVVLDVHEDVLWVPTLAVLPGGRVLVAEDGVLAERTIETGLRNWDRTEVLSGLEAGELVVTSLERQEVRAGAVVEVELEEPSAP